jgi:hypothetical protein
VYPDPAGAPLGSGPRGFVSSCQVFDRRRGRANPELLDLDQGRRSRIEGDKRTERSRSVKVLPGYFGRHDEARSASNLRETLCPCSLIAANGGPNTMNMPELCANVSA